MAEINWETKYVGVTETYDPCYVSDWDRKLLDANIIISKELTEDMLWKLLRNKDKLIFHHTITGLGGTIVEPGVKPFLQEFTQFINLFDKKFPMERYVLRIDPIIPINEKVIIDQLVVLEAYKQFLKSRGFGDKLRVRVSIIDMYPHVRDRFNELAINIPWTSFHAPKDIVDDVYNRLKDYTDVFDISTCSEPYVNWINKVPCVSKDDIKLCDRWNLSSYKLPETPQRKICGCLAKKQILGVKPGQCPHGCIYCYWKCKS